MLKVVPITIGGAISKLILVNVQYFKLVEDQRRVLSFWSEIQCYRQGSLTVISKVV